MIATFEARIAALGLKCKDPIGYILQCESDTQIDLTYTFEKELLKYQATIYIQHTNIQNNVETEKKINQCSKTILYMIIKS